LDPIIMILGTDEGQSERLAGLLQANGYHPDVKDNFAMLTERLTEKKPAAIILDIDAAPHDNHLFRAFKRNNPDVILLGLSAYSFHPALKESMEKHIFACMVKPIDPDEVLFLLKTGCDESHTDT